MIKAVVFTSNSGFTKEYALMLSTELKVDCYTLKNVSEHLKKNDEIIYLGWLLAGKIKGFSTAKRRYCIRALCGVGMGTPNSEELAKLKARHKINSGDVFLLQGGFDINRLSGIYKFMMNFMSKSSCKSLDKKEDKTEEELKMLSLMKEGGSFVSRENLNELIAYIVKK